jgi:FMN phosphatase YigB (HAD superfamily)
MHVAIVHYHLGQGGVPQVIRNTSLHLTQQGVHHTILIGHHLPEDSRFPLTVVPTLGYDEDPQITADSLLHTLQTAAEGALGTAPDIWHVHNHSLGKNRALTEAIVHLASQGARILLHLHDLAEDGRAALYAKIRTIPSRYPLTPRIHYAFLNQRDRDTFLTAGLPAHQSSILQGPLPKAHPAPPHPRTHDSPPLLFAPIRGIRRKNLGELVLLSRLLPPPIRIAISRAPSDPVDYAHHETWRAFASIHAPRIDFAVTGRISPTPHADSGFESWVHHATHVVGTSIAEGLGLPFLEASLWQRPFLGRRLPHLGDCVNPDACYNRLLIPKDWISVNGLREQLTLALARDDRMRQAHPRLPDLPAILHHLTQDEWLDFGNLPESLQQAVIERASTPHAREEILVDINGVPQQAVPWLLDQVHHPRPSPALTSHRTGCPQSIYQSLLRRPAGVVSHLFADGVFNAYHSPRHFHFLTAPPAPQTSQTTWYQLVIFDIYDTLLHTTQGPVRPDPATDPALRHVIRQWGYHPPASPTTALYEAIQRHHRFSPEFYPEIDLRTVWKELLSMAPPADLDRFVHETEAIRSPSRPIRGAFGTIRRLAASGLRLGILSNAQCNAMPSLDGLADLFDPGLVLLSHEWGCAKPSPALFEEMSARIEALGIPPERVLYIGNSPDHDILPAQAHGWHTAHFTAHTTTACQPTLAFQDYAQLTSFLVPENPTQPREESKGPS